MIRQLQDASTLKVCIVGFGWFGRLHVDAWMAIEDIEIVALCDSSPDAFRPAAQHYQDNFHRNSKHSRETLIYNIPRFSDIAVALQEVYCDIVVVTTPEASHAAIVRVALIAGCHVVVEKPFTTNPAEAVELTQQSQANGLHLFIGNILRWDDRYVHLLDDQQFDKNTLRYMSFQRNFQQSALEVYGRVHPFFGACIHDIDLAIWAKGRRPDRVFGSVARSREQHRIICAIGLLEWNDGTQATLQNNWLLHKSTPAGFTFESQFFLEEQTLVVHSQPTVSIENSRESIWPDLFFWPTINGQRSGALVRELAHFVDCIKSDRASERMSLEHACWGIETADALIRSSESRTWIDL
ncbi:Gfo/Idh/MocA family protein [Pseudomonas sp. LRF_L74]|uniref:Gfo/Idh/MocA family protein n=1 Tax=Pseudomonas sp. LRF_L74 TaxID=3369422 RepID=UPI003F607663